MALSLCCPRMRMEALLAVRRLILLCVLLGVLGAGLFFWRGRSSLGASGKTPRATVTKQPVNFASRTFDPNSPPSEMPSLGTGEEAECDSTFLSGANVAGQTQKTDGTHAFVTITRINVTLQLNVTIWAPANATPHVIEHEGGHRQIAEYYYQTADQLAERIAEEYTSQVVEISGTDLEAESNKALQQIATEITDEYNKELNPGPTQLLYDSITDHGRNEVIVKDAVASAIKNVPAESPRPAATPGN
jgi:hypothetical protein